MEKPSLEEVKEYFKDAAKIKDHAGDIGFLEADKLEFTILGDEIIQNTGRPNWLVLWCSDEGYAKILTYKNTEPKFEITKEQILELYNRGNPQPLIRKMFPQAFETVLEVGKWYKNTDKGFEKYIACVVELIKKDTIYDFFGYGFNRHGNWESMNSDEGFGSYVWIEATTEEVTEALKKEAVKRYKKGDYIKCLNGVTVKVQGNTFDYKEGCLYLSDSVDVYELFSDGVWAEIIPTKTIQQAEEILKELGHEIKIVS